MKHIDDIEKIITYNRRKFLCIEENLSNSQLIKKIIEKFYGDMEFISASHGYSGLDLISDNKFEFIFIDLHLTDIDGEQIIKIIRKSELNNTTPICISDTNSENPQIEKCLQAGATLFLGKPLQLNLFKLMIEKYIH